MVRLLFKRDFQVSGSKINLRYPHSPPKIRSGRNVGPSLVDGVGDCHELFERALCLKPERSLQWPARQPIRVGFNELCAFHGSFP